MSSQNLGELASNQKIDKVFHVYGYSIPVAKDGGRLWSTKLKREMGQGMRSGTLSVGEVRKTCRVSDSTAYNWKKHGRGAAAAPKQTKNLAPNSTEVKVESPSDNFTGLGASSGVQTLRVRIATAA
ncbi:hypothetical protein SAMN04488030_0456 [Aliiroseovarius halocynthiae]|uniref:Uncharacterized protein n=1 Tax=Aliiroseovarius halocynthiae TaxID=985055 RepID=A0A545SU09_9RHOB|nr:hypothetical protein [Aliiroseovarius halocynthiae]TQV68443.1 hypothetical protein FIL88_02310 [Aliiroseovarius halocynthiae]SMR70839.1 hypothetical protein SAMN04488030_0456 [Aliiroseovarius halocynthiae]